MESIVLSPKSRTPRDKYTPSPRPFIHLKRCFNSPHSSPFTPPTPPKYRISWFHSRLARRNGHEITKAAAARMSRKQLVDADWEKQKKELLEAAAEENASIIDKGLETDQGMQSPYDPNAELSISVPTWIMFPKTPKIRKHARSPLHKVSKATASQIRNNLVRSPSRCHIKAPVFEENHAVNNLNPQTPNMATLTRSTNWEFTPIKLTNDTMVDELACEVRIMKAEVKDLRRKLKNAMLRNKELEDAAQISLSISHVLTTGRVTWSPFFKKSFVWLWKLVPQTSRCYIIFHVLCYCARVLKPDSAV